ncbi:MAG TPA: outer membrane protein transport protein [Frateuria sp.]|uniref:OmpP1/FadL family transporter n=1 Tax=Frateuria sp. TaxID=2211372 RepID=UPI002DE309D2|nr:outer membrane protein transport protein [Frateuria sp.]
MSFRSVPGVARPLALAALSLAVAGALALPEGAHASAFQLKENSAKGLGRAYAGSATAGGDVSVVANNPAAMSDLDGTYFQADVTAVNFGAKFNGSAYDALGRPISGGNGGDAGTTLPVPALSFATKVSDRVNVGIALDVPFGFQTEYDHDWMGRYDAIKTKLQSFDSTLSASFKINDQWSVGASAIAERTNADLTNAVNVNAIGLKLQQGIAAQAAAQAAAAIAQVQAAVAAGQISPAQAAAMIQQIQQQAQQGAAAAAGGVAAATPVGADGSAEVKGNSWAWGWQAGAYWKPTANDRVALDYRSRITHDIDGTANFTTTPGYGLLLTNPALAANLPPFQRTAGKARLTNPAVATLSYWHQEEKFGLGFDLAWTQWSVMRQLTLTYANPAQPTTVLPFNWRDTWYASVGGEYYATDKLTLRAGVAVDQAPMNASNRDPRVPDAARRMATFGIGYKASDRFEINASYAHIFVSHAGVNGATSSTGDVLTGSYDDYGNLLSLSAQYKF